MTVHIHGVPTAAEFQLYFFSVDVDQSDISEWLEADSNDRGYKHLNDKEIIAKVLNPQDDDSSDSEEMAEQDHW